MTQYLALKNRNILEMLIVSHIDDDHINGVVALTDELAEYRTAREVLRQVLSLNQGSPRAA